MDFFTYWDYGDGNQIEIASMDDCHIRNCIDRIKEAQNSYYNDNNSSTGVFSQKWVEEKGEKYIRSFKMELEIRSRIKSKQYPVIDLKENCDTCEILPCMRSFNKMSRCDDWKLFYIRVFDYCQDYIEQQVAVRGGCYVNGQLYLA